MRCQHPTVRKARLTGLAPGADNELVATIEARRPLPKLSDLAWSAAGAFGHRLALLAVVLLALGWVVSGPMSVHRYATGDPFRTDYLAFDTAATILRDGDASQLFDRRVQQAVQHARAGDDGPSYVPYLHPPVVAAAYLPLSGFTAREGYVVAVGVLAAIMLASAPSTTRSLDTCERRVRVLATICLVGSTAAASALISAQLTPLLLLISGLALLAYRSGRPRLAGVVLGLLLIKPHVALAVFVVLLLARQRAMAAWMAFVVAAGAMASLLIVGGEGAERYVVLIERSYSEPASLYIDVRTEQNLAGTLATVLKVYGGTPAALAGAAVTLVALVLVWRAVRRSPYTGADQAHYVAALAAAFICATAAHIHFYDLALAGAAGVVRPASLGNAADRGARPRLRHSRAAGVLARGRRDARGGEDVRVVRAAVRLLGDDLPLAAGRSVARGRR